MQIDISGLDKPAVIVALFKSALSFYEETFITFGISGADEARQERTCIQEGSYSAFTLPISHTPYVTRPPTLQEAGDMLSVLNGYIDYIGPFGFFINFSGDRIDPRTYYAIYNDC